MAGGQAGEEFGAFGFGDGGAGFGVALGDGEVSRSSGRKATNDEKKTKRNDIELGCSSIFFITMPPFLTL